LDGIITEGLALNSLAEFFRDGVLEQYRLRAGTDAEASPWIIRPDDYNAVTNAKVWELVSKLQYPGDTIRDITGLSGGGMNLDGVPTTGLPVGCILTLFDGTAASIYRLRTGTDGTASPYIIRPIDFQSVTNPKVWAVTPLNGASLLLTNVPVFADNATALAGSLPVNAIYRTGSDPDQLCIVH
jgi:hypothetical protein